MRYWILIEFCIWFFMIKYSKFTDSKPGKEILALHFVKIPTNFEKVGVGGEVGGVTSPRFMHTHTPTHTPAQRTHVRVHWDIRDDCIKQI